MHIIVKSLPHADLDPVNEQGEYSVVRDWVCRLSINGVFRKFTIKAGYIGDGASVPRGFRWLIERDGVHRESALLHDYLYESKKFKRKETDQIFRECLKFQGLASWKVFLMYNAVRIGGGLVW